MHQIRLRVCNVLKFWTQAAHRAAPHCNMLRCDAVQRTNAAQRNAAKRNAALRSTAQHSTAQHSTAAALVQNYPSDFQPGGDLHKIMCALLSR